MKITKIAWFHGFFFFICFLENLSDVFGFFLRKLILLYKFLERQPGWRFTARCHNTHAVGVCLLSGSAQKRNVYPKYNWNTYFSCARPKIYFYRNEEYVMMFWMPEVMLKMAHVRYVSIAFQFYIKCYVFSNYHTTLCFFYFFLNFRGFFFSNYCRNHV